MPASLHSTDYKTNHTLAGGTKSGTYILRSLLPSKIIAKMAVPNTGLSVAINDVSEAVDGEAFDSEGVMVDWKRSRSELGSMGLLFFILSLILLNGRSLPEGELPTRSW